MRLRNGKPVTNPYQKVVPADDEGAGLGSPYVVSAGDHRRFTVSLAPTGEARTEDTEVTEDFLVIDEPLPCRFSPTKLPRRPFSVFPDLRDLRVLRASLLRW